MKNDEWLTNVECETHPLFPNAYETCTIKMRAKNGLNREWSIYEMLFYRYFETGLQKV